MKKTLAIHVIIWLISCSSIHAQYNIQGDAEIIEDNCYQLTAASPNQIGTIWNEQLINLNLPFELQFKMNFGVLNGGTLEEEGADGMMFVLQNSSSTAVGVLGEDIGYGNLDPSLGIEFDTFYNQGLGDIYPDHIAIHRDGNTDHASSDAIAGPIQADPNDVDIEDGEDHAISITWDPINQELSVHFDCQFRLSTNVDLVNDIFDGESQVWWGFTASTGGSFNAHSVCLYENVSPSGDITVCPGFSTQLIAGGNIFDEYSWFPIEYLDDPTAYNPVASPPSSQVYTVTYTDFCNQTTTTTIEVTVEPIEAQIYADEDGITCLNDDVSMTAYTNYPFASIVWTTIEGGELEQINNNVAVANDQGVYMITVISEDGNCSSEDVYEVLLDTLSYEATTGPSSTLNCYSSTYILQGGSNYDDAEFSWATQDGQFLGSSFDQNPTVVSEGVYTLTVTNPINGCITEANVEIDEDFTEPIISLGYPSGIISCETPSVQIEGTNVLPDGYTNIIEWSEVEGELIDSFSLDPYSESAGEFSLTVTFEENGCTSSSEESIVIEVDENAFVSLESLSIPNIFTPNGDAFNSEFSPLFTDPELSGLNPLDVLDYWNFKVLDRWGMLVYENNGEPEPWLGINKNGNRVNSDTYLIEVSYESQCGENQRGEYMGTLKVIVD